MDAFARNTIAKRMVKRNLAMNAIAEVVLVAERVKCRFWSWADTWRHESQSWHSERDGGRKERLGEERKRGKLTR